MSRFALLVILLGSFSVSFLACNGGGPGGDDAGSDVRLRIIREK